MTYSRKLQQLGESLFVSLPKKWIRQMQLEKGKTVELIERSDNSILIYAQTLDESDHTITLNVTTAQAIQSIKRRLIGAYLDGYDIIHISSSCRLSIEQQNAIRRMIDDLFGLEIITISSTNITTQCLLSKTLPIENMIQRIHDIITVSLQDLSNNFIETDTNILQDIIRRKRDVQRITLVVYRLLRMPILFPGKTSKMTLIDNVDYQRVVDKMNEVFKNITQIVTNITSLQSPSPHETAVLLHQRITTVTQAYDNAVEALMLQDITGANKVLDLKMTWDNSTLNHQLFQKQSIEDLVAIIRLMDNLQYILILAHEIAEIAIDKAEEPHQEVY